MRAIASIALVVALFGAACESNGEPTDLTASTETRARADLPVTTMIGDPPLAVVFGDSNTYQSTDAIRRELADAGLTPDVRGVSGSGLKDNAIDWLPAARQVTQANPAVVVIALGTNDAVFAPDVEAFAARAEELLAALGDLPIVWVTHTQAGGNGRDPADERHVNDVIRSLPSRHPNVTVLDLAPEIDSDPTILGDDRLHFSDLGVRWFAERIAEAAREVALARLQQQR